MSTPQYKVGDWVWYAYAENPYSGRIAAITEEHSVIEDANNYHLIKPKSIIGIDQEPDDEWTKPKRPWWQFWGRG